MNYLDAALSYLDRGFSVLPVNRHKAPAVRRWGQYQTRLPTEAEVRQWFKRTDLAGVGVVCGSVSGDIGCRDFDAVDPYEIWTLRNPKLATVLPTARTGRGFQVWAVMPGAKYADFGDGELRVGNKHMTVLPPSMHPSGRRYEWIVPMGKTIPVIDPVEAGFLPVVDAQKSPIERENNNTSCKSDALGICGKQFTNLLELDIDAQFVANSIALSRPTGEGQRHRAIFQFIRLLHRNQDLQDIDPSFLKSVFRQWFAAALPNIRTRDFVTNWGDFVSGWPKVKHPHGQGPMGELLNQYTPEDEPAAAAEYDHPGARKLVWLCRELQREKGAGVPFYLSTRGIAPMVDVSHVSVSAWLSAFCADGVLRQVTAASRAKHKAAEYVYLPPLDH